MTQKIRAYRVNEKTLKRNTIPSYNDMADGVASISPVKIRNMGSWNYHVAEDVKGNIYLIEDDLVRQYKLYDRNLGVTETPYMLDSIGTSEINRRKVKVEENNTLQKDSKKLNLNSDVDVEEDTEETIEQIQQKIQELRKSKETANDKNI